MSGIIEGYNYDIFISYRQKDNKGERWVSEFVEALKTELESTFKENVSVYFDENPDDRLGDTHDVDRSLQDKLKCLIFVPILSQTYCDTHSYAWQKELVAFIEMAENDRFGKDIRLRSGNVAGRILPIRIHDLEPEDVRLFEKQTGSTLRTMDFVFRTVSGVSRPLLPDEDHPTDNLDKTFYRDQINKTAHAIKEIILGMQAVSGPGVKEKEQQEKSFKGTGTAESRLENAKPFKSGSLKWIIVSVALALVTVAAVLLYPIIFKETGSGKSKTSVEKSIAVLPFRNDSPDSENQHFIDGTMDAILDNLCKVANLKVISRTSVEQYRNPTKAIGEIARELKVRYILEGGGQKYGDEIRLTVQLIDAESDKHIWSSQYDRNISDIFKIQSEIAKDVAAELRAALSPEEISEIDRKPTENIEAYNLYLKGRYFLNRRTEDDLKKSISYFEQAIAMDTTFALAYTSLAETYIVLGEWNFSQPDEVFPRAQNAAIRAIRLDDGLAEAHNAMAAIKRDYEWDWKGAEAEYLKAIELNPRYPTTYQWYAEFLSIMGRNSEAIENLKHAQELDPLSPIIYTVGGRIIYPNAKQYDTAIQQCRKALEIDSNYVLAHHSLAYLYFYKKMFPEAIAEAKKVLALSGWISAKILLAKVYASSGRREEAEIILDEVVDNRDKQYISSTAISNLYLTLDLKEQSLDWLEKAYLNREYSLIHIDAGPDFDKLRDEPRFCAILKKMGFEE